MYNDSFKERYGNAQIAISSTEDFAPTRSHIHNAVEILYIEKGTSRIQISNTTFSAKAGDLFFVNPLEVHAVEVDTAQAYCHRCICFEPTLIVDKKLSDDLQKGYAIIPHYFADGDTVTIALSELFGEIYKKVSENSVALLFEATAFVSELFSVFIRKDLLLNHPGSSKEANFCAEVISFVSLHYSERITSKEIAQALFYTQSHFCRRFKSVFGVSFSEYLNMYRLLAAKEQLKTENKSISVIANDCGFHSPNYFTVLFKKTFKIPPLKYKKSIQE